MGGVCSMARARSSPAPGDADSPPALNLQPHPAQLLEEYERHRQAEEEAKKRAYEEDARLKHVRPHQIIAGEVVVKPSHSPIRERDVSAGRERPTRESSGGAGAHLVAGAPFSAGRHRMPSGSGSQPLVASSAARSHGYSSAAAASADLYRSQEDDALASSTER